MPLSNAQIVNEVNNDPAALGYASSVTAKNAVAIADILNWIRNGSTPCPDNNVVGAAISVFRNDIAPKEIVNAIATTDFTAATQIQISKLEMLFVPEVIDATLANVRGNLQSIFSGASAVTTNALSALAQRNGSRAEQLGGTGTTVTDTQVRLAMGW